MDNAKTAVNVLLAAMALGTSYVQQALAPQPATERATLYTFLCQEGHQEPVAVSETRSDAAEEPTYGPTYHVTATAYQAVSGQTDDEPFVTADNSLIKPHYSSKTRWMAISHDLLARWGGKFEYGDKVRITGISPQLDGIYTVHDTMNKRHRHCIDILTHPSEKVDIFIKNVKIEEVIKPAALVAKANPPARALPRPRLRTVASARSRHPRGQRLPVFASSSGYFVSAIL